MKTQKTFASKEEFEQKYPYVTVIFSEYQPASIENSFSSKANARTSQYSGKSHGNILTRKQASKQIAEWNKKYFLAQREF